MEYRQVGSSGLVVSAVGLGTNNFGMKIDAAAAREVLDAALDAGITLLDTANAYGESEERLGELLHGRRGDVVLATKFGGPLRAPVSDGADWGIRASRRYVRRAVEGSLRRLRTDWIDLYQLHRPDPRVPIEETLSVLSDLVREGKIRYFGHSNLAAWQIADADWTARVRGYERFVSAQHEYSLVNRGLEQDTAPALQHYALGLLAYFPLASGLLSGKYRRGQKADPQSRIAVWGQAEKLTDEIFDMVETLENAAEQIGRSLLEIAVGRLIAQPFVASVLIGATSGQQVLANVAAGSWRPTTEEIAVIDEACARVARPGKPVRFLMAGSNA